MYHGLFQTALFLKNLFSSYQLYDKALVCCCYPSVIYQVRIKHSIQLYKVPIRLTDFCFMFFLFCFFYLVWCLLIYQIKCTLILHLICLSCPFSSKHFLMTFYSAFKVTSEATCSHRLSIFIGVWRYYIISLDTQDRSENHNRTSLVERQLQLHCNWRKGTSWDW